MVFQFGQYKVDIDVERTRRFYQGAQRVGEGCACDGCANFERAIDTLPEGETAFLGALGIDMHKICECYVNCRNPDGTLWYGGFCHACGTILEEGSASVPVLPSSPRRENGRIFSASGDMRIFFQDVLFLLEDGFPLPAIQLELSVNLPWVLEKENTYR